MKKNLYIYLFVFPLAVFSQQKEVLDSLHNNIDDYIFVKPGDTATIKLNEITLLPKPKFKSRNDISYYLWFRRKVFKAYPYAKLASERLDSLNARLERIPSKRKKRKYVKQIQNYVEGEFTDQIKKLTRTEGRILIKLVHRQTGKTVFDNIKGLKSGWKAFWYNTTAVLFKLSLKDFYHTEFENEDYLIEFILHQAFQADELEEQETRLDFDFDKILISKKAEVNVQEYKDMFSKTRNKKAKKKNQRRGG